VPIASLRPAGHGKYGNKLAFRFERDITAERDRDMKMYRMTILDTFQSTTYKSSYRGSLVNSTTGKFVSSLEDVVDDMGDDSVVKCMLFPENVEYIYNQYKEFLGTIDPKLIEDTKERAIYDASANLIVDQFDPIFGTMIANNTSLYKLDIVDDPI